MCALLPSTRFHSTLQSFLPLLPFSPIVSDTPQMPEVFGLKAPPPLWMGIWPFDKPSFIKTTAPSTHLSVDRSQPPSFFIWRQPPQAPSPGLPSCQSSTLLRSRVILMATKRTHGVPLFKPDPRTGWVWWERPILPWVNWRQSPRLTTRMFFSPFHES